MKKIVILLVSLIGIMLFSGCAGKMDVYAAKSCNEHIQPLDKLTVVAISSASTGMPSLTRETDRKEAVKNLFQAIAQYGIKIKKPYFYIVKPTKFANLGINTMEKADEACIEKSGGVFTTALSMFDDTGINRACDFTLGGNDVYRAYADVEYFTKPQLNVLTFNSYDVIKYLKKNGYYLKKNNYQFHNLVKNDIYMCQKTSKSYIYNWYEKWERNTK